MPSNPAPKKTLKQDVQNLVRATKGVAKTLLSDPSNVSPASKIQQHHQRTAAEIERMNKGK